MRVGIFANTPAQIYFYRNIAKALNDRGHETRFLIRDYRETRTVANELGIDYYIYARGQSTKIGRLPALPYRMFNSMKHMLDFKPDILLGFGVYDAYTAALLRKPCIEFEDSEPRVNLVYSIELNFYLPFVDAVITPESFLDDLGSKHVRIKGYKELAYLHRYYFKPDDSIFEYLGGDRNDNFVLLRFNAFDAVHDAGIRGFTIEHKKRLVEELEKYATVFISSEGTVSREFEKYRLKIPLHRIHDLLYYAKLLVGDGQTMTTEAGILGTPAIRCNSFVGEKDMSNFAELEKKYGLIFNYSDPEIAIQKAVELIGHQDLKQKWLSKVDRLFEDKIDVTKFMVWFIEEYPESMKIMKKNPESQFRFK